MNTMKLCDLHTHILPGVDDGAPTVEYALQMLQNAVASDVQLLAATPHWGGPYGEYDLQESFRKLQRAAEAIPVQLVPGAEVRVDAGLLCRSEPRAFPTINGSRYLLAEFAADTPSEAFPELLERLLDGGYIPLVAHPERYRAVQNMPERVFRWLDMGCHLQLTGGSLFGEYGKTAQRTAAFLLRNDAVACVASDAHGIHSRSNFLMAAYDHLAIQYSRQYAQCLLQENPMRICRNEDL